MTTKLTLTMEGEVIDSAKKICPAKREKFIGYSRELFKVNFGP